MVMPGDFFKGISSDEPDACCCVDGCDKPIYGRRAGEVDSFGVEWDHFCKEHYFEALNKPEEPVISDCEWCKAVDVEVFPTRDTDEGSHGPVYDVCKGCREKQIKRDMEDLMRWEEEQEEDLDPYEDEHDCRVNPHDLHMDPDEDPEQAALNDLEFALSQSTILTRQDIRTLFKGEATEAIRKIADDCTEGEYSRLFPVKSKLAQLNPLALAIEVSDELPKSEPTGKGDLTSPLMEEMRASRGATIKLLYEKGPVDKQSHVSKLINISVPNVKISHTHYPFWVVKKLKAKKGPRVIRTIRVI